MGKVIKFKEIIGYKNIKNSEEYNSIIDIKSFDGLLTFPILKKKNKRSLYGKTSSIFWGYK